ncbi:MAG TPA: hypothetical protein VMN37_09765 [Gemmatimonadales bacterium]|nr:hypothetical protein [Gemmatimonadales bacterium]
MTSRSWLVLALAVVAGGGLAASAFARWSARPTVRDRVAVSVFANRTGDSTLEPLGSMAADWITRGLAQLEDVEVVDVGAVHAGGRSEAGEPTDPVVLARRNGAGTVVSGSYYLATDTPPPARCSRPSPRCTRRPVRRCGRWSRSASR